MGFSSLGVLVFDLASTGGIITNLTVTNLTVTGSFSVAANRIVGEIIDYGVLTGIITRAGSWFSYGDTKIGQGRDSVVTLLNDNHELANEIESKIREFYGI